MVRCHGRCHCSVPLLHAGHCWVPCGKLPLLGAIAGCNVPFARCDGGCHVVRCHCWVLGAIAAAIAGCKRRGVTGRGAIAGCHGQVPLLGAMW